jgi:hypothetical protein
MVAGVPAISIPFCRFPSPKYHLNARALAQFDHGDMLEAATLLADVRNGTSAGWLGSMPIARCAPK